MMIVGHLVSIDLLHEICDNKRGQQARTTIDFRLTELLSEAIAWATAWATGCTVIAKKAHRDRTTQTGAARDEEANQNNERRQQSESAGGVWGSVKGCCMDLRCRCTE